MDDLAVPVGSIFVQILDPAENPLSNVVVTLQIDKLSIAQGDTTSTALRTTNEAGFARFDNLTKGTGFTYRVSMETRSSDGKLRAVYGVPKFQLAPDKGWGIVLHRFPVGPLTDAVLMAADTVVEVHDDALEIAHTFEVVNQSLTTWGLGEGMLLALPKGAKGLRHSETSGDHVVAPFDQGGAGARWLGSLPPGPTQVIYDYKVPYDSSSELDVEIPLPPHVIVARVRTPVRKGMSLEVDGFGAAKDEPSPAGIRVLSALREVAPPAYLGSIHVRIRGVPTPGNSRYFAVAIALMGIAAGLWISFRKVSTDLDVGVMETAKRARQREILADLRLLKEAHDKQDVGPKAYTRERARLMDALAEVV